MKKIKKSIKTQPEKTLRLEDLVADPEKTAIRRSFLRAENEQRNARHPEAERVNHLLYGRASASA